MESRDDAPPPAVDPAGEGDRSPPPPARPLLAYTDRRVPPPPADDTAAAGVVQFAAALVTYLSLVVAMKLAALRFGWDVGAICGTWLLVLAVSVAVCGWTSVALGWRGTLAGLFVGVVLTLLASALIVGRG